MRTIYEVLPELCEAVDLRDPKATARSLNERGFEVRWTLIDFDEAGAAPKRLRTAPDEGVIISVLDRQGRYENVPSNTRKLDVEVTKDESAHPVGEDAACS